MFYSRYNHFHLTHKSGHFLSINKNSVSKLLYGGTKPCVMRSVTIMCHILCSHRANKRLQTALKTQTCIVFDIFCRISFKTLMKRNLPILGARILSWVGIEILEIHYSLFTIHTHTLGFGIHSNSHSKKYCAYTYLMLGFKL